MPFARACRLIFSATSLCLFAALAAGQVAPPQVTGKKLVYEEETKNVIYTGDAQLVSGETVITADEIRYSPVTNVVTGTGKFVLISGRRRLVADAGTYNLADK